MVHIHTDFSNYGNMTADRGQPVADEYRRRYNNFKNNFNERNTKNDSYFKCIMVLRRIELLTL